jgi:hypothetical protein
MGCHISDHNITGQIAIQVGLLISEIEGIPIQVITGILRFNEAYPALKLVNLDQFLYCAVAVEVAANSPKTTTKTDRYSKIYSSKYLDDIHVLFRFFICSNILLSIMINV